MSKKVFFWVGKTTGKRLVYRMAGAVIAVGSGVHSWVTSLTLAAIVKAVVVGSVAFGATAAFTFSFGDKVDLSTYAQEALKLIDAGKQKEAIDYTSQLITALDSRLESLEKRASSESVSKAAEGQDKSSQPTVVKKPTIDQMLHQGKMSRQTAELLRANIQMTAGAISQEDWLAIYEKTLNAVPEDSGWVISSLVAFARKDFTRERISALLRKDLPAKAREKLALLWLAVENASGGTTPADERASVYRELINGTAQTDAALRLLRECITKLDQLGKQAEANEALDNLISIFPDSPLGSLAIKFRLGATEPGSERASMVVDLFEKYPQSAIGKELLGTYVAVLMKRGEFSKALAAVDREQSLGKVQTQEEGYEVLLRLAERACQLQVISVEERLDSSPVATDTSANYSPVFICRSLAKEFLERGEYAISSGINFCVLRSMNRLPIDLITGQVLRRASDVGKTDDPHVANFFCVCVMRAAGEHDAGDVLLEKLYRETPPSELRSYVLNLKAQRAAEVPDYDLAISCATEALKSLPDSLPLVTFHADLLKEQRQSVVRANLDRQRKACLAAAKAAQTGQTGLEQYEKAIALSLALDDIEQAVGACLAIAERFPEHTAAPAAIADGIRIMAQADAAKYSARIQSLTERLQAHYPNTREARELGPK
jgi:tetratricopeptide (TPR) repeat protein